MGEITRLLRCANEGNERCREQLLALLYDELRCVASQKLSHERSHHSLRPTELVHEAFLRLVPKETSWSWENRRHFFGAAGEAMRRILIDLARFKHTRRRGGSWQRVSLSGVSMSTERCDAVVAVDEALARMEQTYPDKAEVVKLRFFAGMSIEETAEALQISVATANRAWRFAKAWLSQELRGSDSSVIQQI